MHQLDEVDKRILKLLQRDSTLTTKYIANKVNLSPTPVYERIKKMEREGYIKKYVAVLDREKLDRKMIVFCNISLVQHTQQIGSEFVQAIKALPEVVACYNIAGDFDFMLKVLVSDMPHYQQFVLDGLGNIPHIGNAHSVFVMGEIKQSYEVPIL